MKLKDHGSKQSTKSAGNTLSEIIESQIPMCDANFTAMKQELPLIFCSITTELYSIVKSKYNIKKYDPVVSSEIIERSIFEYAEDEDAKMLTYEEALAQERTDEVDWSSQNIEEKSEEISAFFASDRSSQTNKGGKNSP